MNLISDYISINHKLELLGYAIQLGLKIAAANLEGKEYNLTMVEVLIASTCRDKIKNSNKDLTRYKLCKIAMCHVN